jgi:hypothetical protein
MFKSLIVSRMDFIADGLTAGEKLQNSFPFRFAALRGLKQYPRKSNETFGLVPRRFESRQ